MHERPNGITPATSAGKKTQNFAQASSAEAIAKNRHKDFNLGPFFFKKNLVGRDMGQPITYDTAACKGKTVLPPPLDPSTSFFEGATSRRQNPKVQLPIRRVSQGPSKKNIRFF